MPAIMPVTAATPTTTPAAIPATLVLPPDFASAVDAAADSGAFVTTTVLPGEIFVMTVFPPLCVRVPVGVEPVGEVTDDGPLLLPPSEDPP